jgi:hypothetical protein
MIRILLIILAGLFNNCSSNRQSAEPLPCVKHLDTTTQSEYYLYVDVMPEFPGGREELDRFFESNFQSPRQVVGCCTYMVEMIIDERGNPAHITLTPGSEPDFDAEALRVLQMMPRWKPGKCGKKEVPVKMTMILQN